jgi:hypothetical protein
MIRTTNSRVAMAKTMKYERFHGTVNAVNIPRANVTMASTTPFFAYRMQPSIKKNVAATDA